MRIGINAQLCSSSSSYRNAGVSQYIWRLLQGIGEIQPAAEIHVFLPGANRDSFHNSFVLHKRKFQTEHPLVRIAWEHTVFPFLISSLKLDVIHSPVHVLPVICPTASVVTVLDLAFMRYPRTYPLMQWKYLEFFTRRAVKKADAIITISESTRQEVIRLLGGEPRKIHTVLLAAGNSFRPASSEKIEEIKKRYGFDEPCVLYVGTLEPRKNVQTLLLAFDKVRRELDGRCKLVIAGGKGWFYSEIFRRIEDLGICDDVRFTGYVPAEDLPALYSSATVFVYPSLYEGFGLPPLEAMACGTPVITSNVSSLPEVVGDAGIMVDPRDPQELAEAIIRVLEDADLRLHMREKGLRRASEFTWRKTARQTLEVYEKVAAT
jgi:glycosyltransferase involved in cell wall biosynthesis